MKELIVMIGAVVALATVANGRSLRVRRRWIDRGRRRVAAGEGRPPYRVFLYFPPKAGKFEGCAAEFSLVWDGIQFGLDE